jgi:hypothetical protein
LEAEAELNQSQATEMAMKGWNRILLLIFLCFLVGMTHGQSEPESETGNVYLQSQIDSSTVPVPMGSILRVRYRNNPRAYHVVLQGTTGDSVILNADTVKTIHIDEVSVRNQPRYRKGQVTFWTAVGILAAFWLLFIIRWIDSRFVGDTFWLVELLWLFLLLLALLTLPIVLPIGILLMYASYKRYRLKGKWQLRIRK